MYNNAKIRAGSLDKAPLAFPAISISWTCFPYRPNDARGAALASSLDDEFRNPHGCLFIIHGNEQMHAKVNMPSNLSNATIMIIDR